VKLIGRTLLVTQLLFLIGPLLLLALTSLSAGDTLEFPPDGLSLRWMARVFEIESFRASFTTSLLVAVASTIFSLILGLPAAYAFSRYTVPFGEAIRLFLSSPIIVPGIVVGLALLDFVVVPFALDPIGALLVAHTALLIPYSVRVVGASLAGLRVDIEEAAVLLGSTRLGAFRSVVLPNIQNGVMAAAVLGFITSFNQVPVSLFLTGPGVSTLPIDMLAYVEATFDPSMAALSVMLAVLSLIIVFATERLLGLSKYV
jgi:putative spermidine/putrescine transport system permease protein